MKKSSKRRAAKRVNRPKSSKASKTNPGASTRQSARKSGSQTNTANVRLGIDLALRPAAAFELVIAELALGLARAGMTFEPGPNGRVVEAGFEVGQVVSWNPAKRVL